MDDIPEAVRESTFVKSSSSSVQPRWFIWGLLSLGAIALLIITITKASMSSSIVSEQTETVAQDTPLEPNSETNLEPNNTLLGHFQYEVAPESELVPITGDGRLKLRRKAAEKFNQMQAAARRNGVILVPISAFRDISEQQYLFFQVKEQRGQNTAKRAEVSAPPGYSEHHTGYAIDLGDGYAPGTNLSPKFEKTAAFQWLKENAAYYSFELSFPEDNPQGISYEPWHWRFVGDAHSLETFYKARNFQ
jgi:D-alanyl-D-alanine carboxypeptidase